MNRTIGHILLPLLALCGVLTVSAQTGMRSLDTGGGLSSNTVRSIVQDRYGLIWIGTAEGLDSFDGHEVTHHDFAHEGMSTYVNCIHCDNEGNLWIGTDDAVYCLRNDVFFQTDVAVSCITLDKEGNIWVGTFGNGLYRYYRHDDVWHAESYVRDKRVETIFVDDNGLLWAFCMDGTVLNYDRMSGTVHTAFITWESGISERVMAVFQDYSGVIWLGTWGRGLFRLNLKTMKVVPTAFTDVPELSHIHCMAGAGPYGLLVGSDYGTSRLDITTGEVNVDGSKRFIYSILTDAEGGLWAGTYYSGVYYRLLDAGRFVTYPLLDGEDCIISCFAQTVDGSMWAGSDNQGVLRFHEESGKLSGHYLSNRNVHSLLPYGDKMLVGSYSGGIDILDYSSGKSTELVEGSVYSMAIDSEGWLWYGTMQGIYRINLPDGTAELMYDCGGIVTSITIDTYGTLWFATENGLLSYERSGEWKSYNEDQGVMSHDINSLYLSPGGTLIVAGDRGISYLLQGDTVFYPIYPDRVDKVLYAVADMENIWFTTTNGLYKFNLRENRTDYYGGETGLTDGGFIAGSGTISADGRIWLGTYMGVTSFHPANIRTNLYSPAALITGLSFIPRTRDGAAIPDMVVDLDKNDPSDIVVQHKFNSVVFTYAALSYRVPERNRFRIMLDGFDENWTETDLRRAVYTNLPAGKYIFKVISSNSDRVWSDTVTEIHFTIRPRRLLSPVAIGIYILIIILTGMHILHYLKKRVQELSERKLKSYVREYERSEKERRTMDFENRLNEIIRENLSNPELSSEMIADRLFVSRSSLFAKVKEITGNTPHQLIQDARLEEAARKLSEGNCSVNDVCYMVGFNSPNYFSKCFKQKYGCNPRDWRK